MTHAAIRKQVDNVLKHEGWPAYSNRAADRGGPTKGGITLQTLSDWRGSPQSVSDLKALTETEARDIYRRKYLQPWEFVSESSLFAVLVDYAVTSGHGYPARALQEKLGIAVDGVTGSATRAAVLAHDQKELRDYVIGYRVRHMVNIALGDSKLKALIKGRNDLQLLNLRGWIARSTSFL